MSYNISLTRWGNQNMLNLDNGIDSWTYYHSDEQLAVFKHLYETCMLTEKQALFLMKRKFKHVVLAFAEMAKLIYKEGDVSTSYEYYSRALDIYSLGYNVAGELATGCRKHREAVNAVGRVIGWRK